MTTAPLLGTMTLEEVLYDYYPTEGALLISHLLTDTELKARWNQKLDFAEESSPKTIEVLGQEYLQNNGYRHAIEVIEDDEEAVTAYVNDGYYRLAALRRLVDDGVIAADDATLEVSTTKGDETGSTEMNDLGTFHAVDSRHPHAMISFDTSEYSLVDVNFEVSVNSVDDPDEPLSPAAERLKVNRAVFDEPVQGQPNVYDLVASFRLNENVWVSMETGSFDYSKLRGSLLLSLDYNANVYADKHNTRIIEELLGELTEFARRVHGSYGVRIDFSLGDLSEVFTTDSE